MSENVDLENSAFWTELCGSHLAKSIGIEDHSEASLAKFDAWYLDFYPYLEKHIPGAEVDGKDVLEIGLGYGTISSIFMRNGARYTGLDIAPGPVEMSHNRSNILQVEANALQGSAKDIPFPDESFDFVVSIWCLHHTGDLPKSLSEVYRVLRPGGSAHIMVYNALSYRQVFEKPFTSARRYFSPVQKMNLTSVDDARYDANEDGSTAPETAFVSPKELRWLLRDFSSVSVTPENIGKEYFFRIMSRERFLKWGHRFGLDLYAHAKK